MVISFESIKAYCHLTVDNIISRMRRNVERAFLKPERILVICYKHWYEKDSVIAQLTLYTSIHYDGTQFLREA